MDLGKRTRASEALAVSPETSVLNTDFLSWLHRAAPGCSSSGPAGLGCEGGMCPLPLGAGRRNGHPLGHCVLLTHGRAGGGRRLTILGCGTALAHVPAGTASQVTKPSQ